MSLAQELHQLSLTKPWRSDSRTTQTQSCVGAGQADRPWGAEGAGRPPTKPCRAWDSRHLALSLPLILEGRVLLYVAAQADMNFGLIQTRTPTRFYPHFSGLTSPCQCEVKWKKQDEGPVYTAGPCFRIEKLRKGLPFLFFLTLCSSQSFP